MRVLIASTWFQLCWFIAVLGTFEWQWLMMILALATLVYSILTAFHSVKAISFVTFFRASSRYAKSTLLAFGFPYPLAPCVVDWSMGIVCMVCLPTESAFAPLRQNLRINIRWAWRNAQLLRWLQASSGRVWVRYKYYVTGLVCGMVGVNAGDSQGV